MHRFALVLVLAACSSGSSASKSGPCAMRTGTYAVTYVQRDGTCGQLPEEIYTYNSAGMDTSATAKTAACVDHTSTSPDQCVVTIDSTCQQPGVCKGCTSETKGQGTWDAAGANASGIIEFVGYNPDKTIGCRSTYDITFAKQ